MPTPSLYEKRSIVGRKDHICSECRGLIKKGERHQLHKGLFDGYFDQFRWCESCASRYDQAAEACTHGRDTSFNYGEMLHWAEDVLETNQ